MSATLPGHVASDTIARAQLAELATVDRERHVAPVDHDERDFIVLGENERRSNNMCARSA